MPNASMNVAPSMSHISPQAWVAWCGVDSRARIYTPAVGGSIPSAPTSVIPFQVNAVRWRPTPRCAESELNGS